MDLGSDPTAFRVMHGYSWPQNLSAAFCGVLGGKAMWFCGLAAKNALRASQAVREMSVMVNSFKLLSLFNMMQCLFFFIEKSP